LVAEIAASSVSYDLHDKLRAFQQNRVREYIVWRVEDEAVDWFVLRQGEFKRLRATADGILKSKVFPGLWLDPAALVRGDLNRLMEVSQQGIGSPEHRRFVDKLTKNQPRKR
jgi:Putative restriction endonuclease